jgi:hypothetical protein
VVDGDPPRVRVTNSTNGDFRVRVEPWGADFLLVPALSITFEAEEWEEGFHFDAECEGPDVGVWPAGFARVVIVTQANGERERFSWQPPPPEVATHNASRWQEREEYRRNNSVVRSREAGHLHTCPCCRHATLSQRGAFEICPVGHWRDDGQDDHDAALVRGANGMLVSSRRVGTIEPSVRATCSRSRSFVRRGPRSERRADQLHPLGRCRPR